MMTLETHQFTIGSSPGCDVLVERPGVSRAHLKVYFSGESVLIEDLNSESGTFVLHQGKYKRIKSAKIKPETKIRLGQELGEIAIKDFIANFQDLRERERKDIFNRIKVVGLKRCIDCGSVLSREKIHCDCCGAIFEEAA